MNWKRLIQKLLFPEIGLLLLFIALSTFSLTYVFINGIGTSLAAIIIYIFSFYTLIVLCIVCWRMFPKYYRRMKTALYKNRFSNHYLTDRRFRTQINLYRSLGLNLIYAIINGLSAIIYHTHWFGIFAVYYTLLACLRFLLIHNTARKNQNHSKTADLRRARLCACLLLAVNLTLSASVLMMSYLQRGFDYPGILIYAAALYTFSATISAVIDLFRCRKYRNPVLAVAREIKLTAALVSMLSLETAMFAQFGAEMSIQTQRGMIMGTGAGISIIIISMAIHRIICATAELKRLQNH